MHNFVELFLLVLVTITKFFYRKAYRYIINNPLYRTTFHLKDKLNKVIIIEGDGKLECCEKTGINW